MKGIIGIKSLKINCIIGNNPKERETEQEIQLDIRMTTDFTRCSQSDDIQDTIDYSEVAKVCEETAKSKHYHLLETYACELVQKLLEEFEVEWISVRIMKPAGLAQAHHTFVEFESFKEQ